MHTSILLSEQQILSLKCKISLVNFPRFGKVYFCGAYWNAPNTGTDSRVSILYTQIIVALSHIIETQAGTIIHESSHFTANGGTNDYAYGQSAAKSLAISNPANAVMNADSHEYFAENNPVLA